MKLFNKDKDFILRVGNLIFLIGLIASLLVLYNGIVNLVFNEPVQPYGVFRTNSCSVPLCDDGSVCSVSIEENDDQSYCESMYNLYLDDDKYNKRLYYKQIIASFLSAITVATTIYLLNKEKKVK